MTVNKKSVNPQESLPNTLIGKQGDLSKIILDSNPLAVTVLDHNKKMIDCNEAAMKLLEFS